MTRIGPGAGADAAQSFQAALRSSTSDVVTVVGHNDDGQLRFVDGSLLPLSELGDVGPMVAMISCDAARYANGNAAGVLPSTVTLDAAVAIEQELISLLNALDTSPDLATLQQLMDQSTRTVLEGRPELWSYRVTVAGAGAATVGIWQIYEG